MVSESVGPTLVHGQYKHNTYRVDDEEVFIQLFLATLYFLGADILPPNTEGLPLPEEGKCRNLEKEMITVKKTFNI